MFIIYTGIILTLISYAASHKENLPISKSCHVGDVAENECNKCICTPNHIFECNTKPCNDNSIPSNKDALLCHPNNLYVSNLTVCLCRKDGSWPHDHCKAIFKSFHIKSKQSCEPNTYVIIDCNVCKCGSDGNLDNKHCTKNECNKVGLTRRGLEANQVYGSCEAMNWYSLAPCQFCFCVSENKLVCNTGNDYSKKLQLGSYNLNVCGKDLLKDAIGLMPENERALRIGDKFKYKTEKPDTIDQTTTENLKEEDGPGTIELNRENNEKLIEQKHVEKLNESEEYYSESEEPSAQKLTSIKGSVGSSTKLPYEEDENNVSDDAKDQSTETEKEINVHKIQIDAQRIKPSIISRPLTGSIQRLPQNFELLDPPPKSDLVDPLSLGDVLKPYLPAVWDKVFRMALRRSMVSVDPLANCTPGSTTVVKCNACFCMKNNKLLCTNNKCHK